MDRPMKVAIAAHNRQDFLFILGGGSFRPHGFGNLRLALVATTIFLSLLSHGETNLNKLN